MAVGDACRQMAARVGTTCFVVQEQVGPGVELLLGARRDPSFGPVVALGTGGVLAEVVRDVSFRLVPVAEEEIAEMFDEGLRPRLLAGPRGLPAVDRPALARALGALSDLMASEPRVLEIDVNPVIAVAAGLVAVDALVIVGEPP
jgi:acetyltransferase